MAKIGLKYPVFAVGTYADDGATTYANGLKIGKAINANLTISHTGATLDADDAIAESDNSVTGGSISLTLDDMSEEAMATVLGYDYDQSKKAVTVKDSDGPYGGLGFVRKRVLNGVESYLSYWLYKVQLMQSSDEGSTRASSGTSFQTITLDGQMMKAHEGFYTITSHATEAEAIAAIKTLAGIA